MKKFLLLIIGIAITNFAISQEPELVSSAGDSFKNTSYQLDWSMGECVTTTHTTGDYIITQGFQQNTYVITAVQSLPTDVNISVYPNPTTDLITIDLLSSTRYNNVITITDINGKILHQKEITTNQEQLDFSNYANGVYLLSVKQKNQLIKSFKIIKN